MGKVHVDLGARSYDIVIGAAIIDDAATLLRPLLHRMEVAIVTDEQVGALHLDSLVGTLTDAGINCVSLKLPTGEATKSWAKLGDTVDWLLAQKIERQDLIIALGGGVIGDLTGFAAAILRRGVRFVQIPTSLLAQVDSSVGGKTGVNSRHGKNLIGAFHQPSLVLADIGILDSLPQRDLIAGYGEVVKYGLLGNADFFKWLEMNGPLIAAGDKVALEEAVRISCQMKADIVMRDETEQGDRALLNLGHTFCHALENATGYSQRLLHGEGVAIGMALAFELSSRLQLCPQEDPSRVRAHLRQMGMKCDLKDIPGDLPAAEVLVDLMLQDKKVLDGALRLILAKGIGQAFLTSDVPRSALLGLLEDALSDRTA